MKIKKLLSIGALALTITTCTSMNVFAAESAGNRENAKNQIIMNVIKGQNIAESLNINMASISKNYVTHDFIEDIKKYIDQDITDTNIKEQIKSNIEKEYNEGKTFKEILTSIMYVSKNSDETLQQMKKVVNDVVEEFKYDYHTDGTKKLEDTINKYFNVQKLNGKLTYGKNSNNKLVVTLERDEQVVLQVSSENVNSLQNELGKINTWADLLNLL